MEIVISSIKIRIKIKKAKRAKIVKGIIGDNLKPLR